MKQIIINSIILITFGMVIITPLAATPKTDNLIQIAILLDTSNSMDGLIDQAKSQLWKIVNELSRAKRLKESPRLEVALFEYGKDTIPANKGHLRMIVPLSTDLDRISDELFSLTTRGGSEYCGRVIQSAVERLDWADSDRVYKAIFIAGNEPFTQGSMNYRTACKGAIQKGIIVNTIFCGNHKKGVSTHWKDGADLTDGKYLSIDQNQKIKHIKTPQDDEIARLGKILNDTYIAYGSRGQTYKARQKKQDDMATALSSEVMVQRSIAKSSKQYKNKQWDLVDAVNDGDINLNEVKKEALPEKMKTMNSKEKKNYIQKMADSRKKLQKEIQKLNNERKRYLATHRKKIHSNQTLDEAILKAIKLQATQKNFTFND